MLLHSFEELSWLNLMAFLPNSEQSTSVSPSAFDHAIAKIACCKAITSNFMKNYLDRFKYPILPNGEGCKCQHGRMSTLQKGRGLWLAAALLLLFAANLYAQPGLAETTSANAASRQNISDSLQNSANDSNAEGQLLTQEAASTPDTNLSTSMNHSSSRVGVEKKMVDLKHLEIEYFAGLTAKQQRHWTYAVLIFERILDNDPNFRDTRAQLAETQDSLKQANTESVLAGFYEDALYAMDRVDLGMARRALQKIHALDPNYRDVAEYLAEIEMMLGWNRGVTPPQFVSNMTISLRDSLNRDVLHALRHEDWMRATISFEKLKIIHPNYRNVEDLLQERWENMNGNMQPNTAVEPNRLDGAWPYFGGAFAAALVLFLFSIAGSTPTLRARYFLWRGNFQRAARIYEKILERDPARVKYFLPLAEIYLGLGKEDERAVKLYKIVLQLNLVTHQRDAMKTIIAQDYVAQGRTDGESIEFLEHALEKEMHKQSLMLSSGKEA